MRFGLDGQDNNKISSSGTAMGRRWMRRHFFSKARAYGAFFSDEHDRHGDRMACMWTLAITTHGPGRQDAQQRRFARGLFGLALFALALGALVAAKAGFLPATGWFLAAAGNALAGVA